MERIFNPWLPVQVHTKRKMALPKDTSGSSFCYYSLEYGGKSETICQTSETVTLSILNQEGMKLSKSVQASRRC